jgi:prepilin-type N-terminal cleavage/methylation domain-containing protein
MLSTPSLSFGRYGDPSPAVRSPVQASSLRPRRKSAAFTLIELLVVMAIIAILAGLGFAGLQGALEAGKKAQARNDVQQVVMAVKAFLLEYGRLPTVDGSSDFEGNNDQLFNVLRGTADQGSQLQMNPRRIPFIELKTVSTSKGGIGPDGKLYDPWGTPYKIRLDGDYDNEISNFYSSGAGFGTLNYSVIVTSAGPDRQFGSGDKGSGTASDDILSWQ